MTRKEMINFLNECAKDLEVDHNLEIWGMENLQECADAFRAGAKALERESKSEWEHDHEILKAYSDGASNILDKIKKEFIDRYPRNYANELELGGRSCVFSLNEILRIIDEYREG